MGERLSSLLQLSGLHFTHKSRETVQPIFNDLSFDLGEGENLSVVGPSGCGKSTLMFLLLGLLRPEKGEILFCGRRVLGPSRDRMIVFQNHALLPWLTCLKNVMFSIETSPTPPLDMQSAAMTYLRKVGLEKFAGLYPGELSGGMQQRLGIARALAADPKLLLLDEPFSSLDVITRGRIFSEMCDLLRREKKTAVLVTHDLQEALRFGERLLILGGQTPLLKKPTEITEKEIYGIWSDQSLAVDRAGADLVHEDAGPQDLDRLPLVGRDNEHPNRVGP